MRQNISEICRCCLGVKCFRRSTRRRSTRRRSRRRRSRRSRSRSRSRERINAQYSEFCLEGTKP